MRCRKVCEAQCNFYQPGTPLCTDLSRRCMEMLFLSVGFVSSPGKLWLQDEHITANSGMLSHHLNCANVRNSVQLGLLQGRKVMLCCRAAYHRVAGF